MQGCQVTSDNRLAAQKEGAEQYVHNKAFRVTAIARQQAGWSPLVHKVVACSLHCPTGPRRCLGAGEQTDNMHKKAATQLERPRTQPWCPPPPQPRRPLHARQSLGRRRRPRNVAVASVVWRQVDATGAWVAHARSARVKGVIHFLGGAFAGAQEGGPGG